MYTDNDLERAVERRIFTASSVEAFRASVAEANSTQAVDEENFKLVASFNDIFVVIACALLLLSAAWVANSIHPAASMAVVAFLSWGLAEFFVLKRKMALPAIVLLMSFVGAVFAFVVFLLGYPSEFIFMLAAAVSSVGAWLHWRRFKVPITIAAGTASVIVFVIATLLSVLPSLKEYILYFIFLGGLISFYTAMKWDSADITRVTEKSDVAFWLHLVSAPLIVHPIFSGLGILDGDHRLTSAAVILGLYLLLSVISVVIDRRAFMVSSLVYVLYALTGLLKTYGLAGDSFAFVGVFIGFSLLLLSGFWHTVREKLIRCLPDAIQTKVPTIER